MPRRNFNAIPAFIAVLAFGVAIGAQAQAPRGKPQPPSRGPAIAEDDREFANKAAAVGIAELELGKIAQTHATNAEVKKFAQRMATEHGKANDELKAIAKAKGVPLPNAPSRVAQIEIEKLLKLTGAKFDQAYMERMCEDHRKSVREFEKQAKSGKDADLKKWAGDQLPALQGHLRVAEATLEAAKKGGKKK